MPTIVGILTFISIIDTISEGLKARNFFICQHFSLYEQLKFRAQLSLVWKKFYNLKAKALFVKKITVYDPIYWNSSYKWASSWNFGA